MTDEDRNNLESDWPDLESRLEYDEYERRAHQEWLAERELESQGVNH